MPESIFGLIVVGALAALIYWDIRRNKIKDKRADLYSDGCSTCYQALHRRCRALVPSLAEKYQLPNWLVIPFVVDGKTLMGNTMSEVRCRDLLSMRDDDFEEKLRASVGSELRKIAAAYRENPLPIWAEASPRVQSILLEKSVMSFGSSWDQEQTRYGAFSPVQESEEWQKNHDVMDESSRFKMDSEYAWPSRQWLRKSRELAWLRKFDQVWDSRDAEYLAEKMLMVQYPKSLGRPPCDIWSEEVQEYFQNLLDLRSTY